MKKVSNLILDGAAILKNVSTTPFLDSELLLCFVLGLVSRSEVISKSDMYISGRDEKVFFSAIRRREKGEYIAHIIGKKDFWKDEFFVDKNVLVPRSDTETMITAFMVIYKNKSKFLRVADLGAGSGCILVSLLREYKNIVGYAIEKMQSASFVVKKNADIMGISSRIRVIFCDWNFLPSIQKCDAIVSNPPYIARHAIGDLMHFEPIEALDGGIDGMRKYIEVFRIANDILRNDNGKLFLEIGYLQKRSVIIFANKMGFKLTHCFADLASITRVLVFSFKASS